MMVHKHVNIPFVSDDNKTNLYAINCIPIFIIIITTIYSCHLSSIDYSLHMPNTCRYLVRGGDI